MLFLFLLHLFISFFFFFFFNDTATTEIYTLSLHDALPICFALIREARKMAPLVRDDEGTLHRQRSEEHTSELQSQSNLVCRLLLEKKKNIRLYPCRAFFPTHRSTWPHSCAH